MSSPDPSLLLNTLQKNGYVLIPSLIPAASPTLAQLRTAAHSTITHALSGSWTHVRTLPRQFPPWPPITTPSSPHLTATGIWGVQHLLHPLLPAHPVFTKTYFSQAVLAVAKALLAPCEDDQLVMELCNLLVAPTRRSDTDGARQAAPAQDFALRWHRDDIPWSATTAEETALLTASAHDVAASHAQYNIALYEDDSLVVVPGSHRRARTAQEREVGEWGGERMPGQIVVRLKAGDAVFYDSNILHRGVYVAGRERATVHGSVGHVRAGERRARNVLQHGVAEWVGGCEFEVLGERGDGVRERAEGMRGRLVVLGERCGGEEGVGYSLEG